MELGMIGLGRMGANLVRRLLRHGHRTVVYDARPSQRCWAQKATSVKTRSTSASTAARLWSCEAPTTAK